MITKERLEEIFETTDSKWEGDNALQGILILAKHTTKDVICGAGHDIIYGPDIDDIIPTLTEAEAIELSKLNWSISQGDHFSCFV